VQYRETAYYRVRPPQAQLREKLKYISLFYWNFLRQNRFKMLHILKICALKWHTFRQALAQEYLLTGYSEAALTNYQRDRNVRQVHNGERKERNVNKKPSCR